MPMLILRAKGLATAAALAILLTACEGAAPPTAPSAPAPRPEPTEVQFEIRITAAGRGETHGKA